MYVVDIPQLDNNIKMYQNCNTGAFTCIVPFIHKVVQI